MKNFIHFTLMKPFLLWHLQCTKCKSTSIPNLIVNELCTSKDIPKYTPLENLKLDSASLIRLLDSLIDNYQFDLNITQDEIHDFINSGSNSPFTSKICELLYKVDVIDGSVVCVDCENVLGIKESILCCQTK